MTYFLAKTEPNTYSIEAFEKEKTTVWNGVRNAQALQAIKKMRLKDREFIYHSGGASAVVGLAEVVSKPTPDPDDVHSWVVGLRFLHSYIQPYTTLADIKHSGLFGSFALVRQSRLSTMEVPDSFVQWLKGRGLKV